MEVLQFRKIAKEPIATSTIHVFLAGTQTLATGLKTMAGAALVNPFTVSQAGTADDWGFAPTDDKLSHVYDIWWEEENFFIAQNYLFAPSTSQNLSTAGTLTFAGMNVSPGEIDGKISGQSFTGFENKTDTVITFDEGTRTFSIAPTGASYNIWLRSIKFIKSAEETVIIPDVEGLVIIIFDDSGALQTVTGPQFAAIYPIPCLIAAYYWDAENQTTLGGAMEERHGVIMDSATHHYLHFTEGTVFRSGGAITVNGDSSIALTDVVCYDEDLELKATNVDVPAADYDQILDHSINGYGMFPVIYLDGALGNWRKYAATQFPWREANSNVVYNQWTGAAWARSELPASWHTAYFVVMTNMSEEPVKIIMGQFAAQKLADVQEASTWEQLQLDNIISAELKVLYRIIVKNTNNPSIVEVQDLRSLQNIPAGTYTANDHNALTGRTALNSHPGTAIGYTPVGSIATASDVESALKQVEAVVTTGFTLIEEQDASQLTNGTGPLTDRAGFLFENLEGYTEFELEFVYNSLNGVSYLQQTGIGVDVLPATNINNGDWDLRVCGVHQVGVSLDPLDNDQVFSPLTPSTEQVWAVNWKLKFKVLSDTVAGDKVVIGQFDNMAINWDVAQKTSRFGQIWTVLTPSDFYAVEEQIKNFIFFPGIRLTTGGSYDFSSDVHVCKCRLYAR